MLKRQFVAWQTLISKYHCINLVQLDAGWNANARVDRKVRISFLAPLKHVHGWVAILTRWRSNVWTIRYRLDVCTVFQTGRLLSMTIFQPSLSRATSNLEITRVARQIWTFTLTQVAWSAFVSQFIGVLYLRIPGGRNAKMCLMQCNSTMSGNPLTISY